MSRTARVLGEIYDWGNSLMWSLALLSVPFWIYAAVYAAPEAQLVAEQQAQGAVWLESRAFCERNGMAAGTREHARCLQDLMQLRAPEIDRLATESERIF